MLKVLILGGGCFWCTEAIFLNLQGVEKVVSGYAGGHVANPTYKEVCSGETGHAECIEVTYDPNKISMEDLIYVHMMTHDPTTLNRQGADVGTQYRSIIFYQTEDEKKAIQKSLKDIQKEYNKPLTTQVEKLTTFYPAEDYHQNYYELNKDKNPYCSVISDKLQKFLDKFPQKVKSTH